MSERDHTCEDKQVKYACADCSRAPGFPRQNFAVCFKVQAALYIEHTTYDCVLGFTLTLRNENLCVVRAVGESLTGLTVGTTGGR